MILITKTFQKTLKKLKSVSIWDIQKEISKHNVWLKNFIELWDIDGRKILKWYLNAKKVRLIVSFTEYNWQYFPFYIVRKETKQGYNISKQSLSFLLQEMLKHTEDMKKWNFEKMKLK